jgi:hypothetical protein
MPARKTKISAKSTKAKRPVAKRATKPKVAVAKKTKRVTKRKVSQKQPPVATAPVVTTLSIPTVAPVTPIPLTEGYKRVSEAPVNRAKLWLTVGLSMAVIVCIWAYSLSQSLFGSQALQISSDQIQLGNFVESIGNDLSDLKANTDVFMGQANQLNTNINNNTNAEEPSNAELDNLFSDIQ